MIQLSQCASSKWRLSSKGENNNHDLWTEQAYAQLEGNTACQTWGNLWSMTKRKDWPSDEYKTNFI